MPGEERRHGRAAPKCARQLAQDQEDENRIEGMQDDVGRMMAGRLEAINLAIERVRQPCQRLPDIAITGTESPAKSSGQSLVNMRVADNVKVVVIVDEV